MSKSALLQVADKLKKDGPLKTERHPRRVRAVFGGQYLFDTTEALFVWEHPDYPQHWIPLAAVRAERQHEQPIDDSKTAAVFQFKTDGKSDVALVWQKGELKDYVRFDFDSLDAWFEEDERIHVHPRDPYKRVEALTSSRTVEVKVDGVTVAKSSNNVFLYETTLRPRYYLPFTSVEWQYLTPSDTRTACPYKGFAKYYNVTVNGKTHKDLVWWHKVTTHESSRIAGHASFYNEKVDIYIDGKLEKK